MSWFNASHLSSFAKQALTTAQKSIDRVLDIKEEDQWGEIAVPTYDDVPGKTSLSGGWGVRQWDSPSQECAPSVPQSTEAITKPVTRTVVDESESFFSAFLSQGDLPTANTPGVVSVPPAKSLRPQEEEEPVILERASSQKTDSVEPGVPVLTEVVTSEPVPPEPSKPVSVTDIVSVNAVPEHLAPCAALTSPKDSVAVDSEGGSVSTSAVPDVSEVDKPLSPPVAQAVDSPDGPGSPGPLACEGSSKSQTGPAKDVPLDSKDPKPEDRQSNTPSPPVSTFSSGTSTTSDIEVLDHESVLSESSAGSRQGPEAKASLNLMQSSFQLLSPSACPDFQRLEEFQKLTESCGSSDAFERIDSFSVQSLDSRSVSEINSDDELPGRACTLASVTTSPSTPIALVPGGAGSEDQEEEQGEGGPADAAREHTLDENEMEESGRSATPVNCEQPEEILGHEDASVGCRTAGDLDRMTEPAGMGEPRESSGYRITELQKIIDELTSRLELRESQLLALSKDKARLEEEFDNLKDEMVNLKEENTNIHSLREEFTQRIADSEKKAQLACKERDSAVKEMKGMREELSTRLRSNETLELIREKEEQIRGLLEEGEKLSKQHLQHSNIIKKLRTKEKESDSQMAKQAKRIKELEEELKHLQQVLDGKEEVEKQHRENIKKLNGMVEKQERELGRLQSDTDELWEKNRSLQAALDSAYKELAELHKANATKDSEAQEAALSREVVAKERLSMALEKAQEESRLQQEALANQVADLRLALQRAEQQQARKEDYLREEIGELQQRLQAAETRNQELSQSVTSATRPLLRQIENLQASLGGQTASWEKLEKNISDRLADAQAQLAVAVERERSGAEELLAVKSQLASLESQNSLLRQEKGRLQGQLDVEKTRREQTEDDSSRERVELENLRGEHVRALEEARKEKLLLTNQLEMEKMKVEQEKKKCYLAQEALRERDRKALVLSATEAPATSTPTLSRSSSISGGDASGLQTSVFSQMAA
ncbi:TATA element modulatory factor isoform X2 [Paramormyrops kingsleyae]|uniref:TATA element modulatory factor isoform X2 n=1 Tax=Paramormyrops kingsleyae TaxID=1676925 RepID=UPI000CD62301|nr:TATA element modulatory factor isoform X2 [Paramormyrops kingsleyae]